MDRERQKQEYIKRSDFFRHLAEMCDKPPAGEILLRKAADDYRGDMSCLTIVSPHQSDMLVDNDGCGDEHAISTPDGSPLGILTIWYGNNGRGKLADESFSPAPGVKVIWEDES